MNGHSVVFGQMVNLKMRYSWVLQNRIGGTRVCGKDCVGYDICAIG